MGAACPACKSLLLPPLQLFRKENYTSFIKVVKISREAF